MAVMFCQSVGAPATAQRARPTRAEQVKVVRTQQRGHHRAVVQIVATEHLGWQVQRGRQFLASVGRWIIVIGSIGHVVRCGQAVGPPSLRIFNRTWRRLCTPL